MIKTQTIFMRQANNSGIVETIPVGFLEYDCNKYRFRYSKKWLQDGFALCPSMSLQKQYFIADTLFGPFMDASPDGWGRRLLQNAEFCAAQLTNRNVILLNDFDFFVRTDDFSRQGALLTNKLCISTDLNLPVLFFAVKNIDAKTSTAEDLRLLIGNGISSAGGARPKISVFYENELYLIKFQSKDDIDPNVLITEAVNLSLAKLCQIPTPDFYLREFYSRNLQKKQALFIKRFDRNGQIPIHYISARTITGKQDSALSYTDIATYCNTNDKKNLFYRLCLNACVSNFDDHGKNHGFIYQNDSWQLSPVFDLESLPNDEMPCHAININNNNPYSSIHNILDLHTACNLSIQEAKDILYNITTIVVDNWLLLAQKFKANKDWIHVAKASYKRATILQRELNGVSHARTQEAHP